MKKIIIALFSFVALVCMAARRCDGCKRVVDEMMFDGHAGKLCTDCAYREMELDSQKDSSFFDKYFYKIIIGGVILAVVTGVANNKK